jgi:hypothetical protein
MRAAGGGLLCRKEARLAYSRVVPRGNYQVSRLSTDCKANCLLPSLPVTRRIPRLMAHLRGPYLEHGAASVSDVRCQAPLRLATHYQDTTSPARLAQTSLTFRSISLITSFIFPLHSCLAMLRVKPLAVWKGTCDGSERANGSTTASTTTGPSL